MISSILFLLFLIPIVLIISVGIPVIIGVLVYRDAKKRVDCKPILWALVAALAPCCIGLILYLVIRKDYPLRPQSQHSGQSEYNQGFREDGQGFTYEQNFAGQTVQPKTALPTWAKALIIISAVVVLVCLLGLVGSAIYSFFGYNTGYSYYGY